MSDYQKEIDALVGQAGELPNGPTRVALLEEAVRIADAHNDAKAGYEARMELIQAATFSGRSDLLLVAFGWCLGQFDRDPERFDEDELLWRYKWVIDNVADLLEVSRPQIEELFADMTRRFERAGASMHSIQYRRREMALTLGDLTLAEDAHRALATASRGKLSDCAACVEDGEADYLVLKGEYEAGVARAWPLVTGGKGCATIPHRTYANILYPLVRLGRLDQAMAFHRRGYPMVATNEDLLGSAAEHLTFLTLTDNLMAARRLFERHLPVALRAVSMTHRFDLFMAGVFFLRRAAGRAFRLRAPRGVPGCQPDGTATPADLAPWLEAELATLAAAFDRRNGNSYYTGRVDRLRDLDQLVTPFPVARPGAEG